jgi:hypothetical protein
VKIAVLLASAIPVRPVAAVIVLTFIIRVLESHLHLPLFKAWARGHTRDASGKHICFDFFSRFAASQTAANMRPAHASDFSDRNPKPKMRHLRKYVQKAVQGTASQLLTRSSDRGSLAVTAPVACRASRLPPLVLRCTSSPCSTPSSVPPRPIHHGHRTALQHRQASPLLRQVSILIVLPSPHLVICWSWPVHPRTICRLTVPTVP